MVLPLLKQYGVSMIKSEDNKVSFHLIHTFKCDCVTTPYIR